VQRADDNQAVVLERLAVYRKKTMPLLDYYRARPTFKSINGAQTPDEVASELARAVDAVANGTGGGG
jgi:adenylate kinase